MKFLCPSCERLAELHTFRVEGPALVLTCERCGVESRAVPAPVAVAAAAPSPPPSSEEAAAPGKVVPLRPAVAAALPQVARLEDPFAVPTDRCPKCVAVRREGTAACPACGLVFENFKPDEHRPSPRLAQAWSELLVQWESHEAHERFVKEANLHEELVSSARLYRLHLARFPEDAMAQHGRDALLKLVAAPALTPSSRPQPERQWLRAAVGILMTLLALAGLWFLFRRGFPSAP